MIVKLAGLDLQPFFSIDAAELFDEALQHLPIEAPSREEQLRLALGAVSRLHLDGHLQTRQMLSIGSRLAVQNDYASEPKGVMELYGLEDEWEGSWGRTKPEIEADVRAIAQEVVDGSPDLLHADIEFLKQALASKT